MMWKRLVFVTLLMGAYPGAARAPIDREPTIAGVRVFHGPRPGFETVDEDLIGRARRRIDMTAYVLTDKRVIAALANAARRGVKVRIYLDPEQNKGREAMPDGRLGTLLRTPNVEGRVKSVAGDLMHLKSYQVDGRYLRSGSANFSFSGEQRQDNDIILIDSADAAAGYAARFEEIWARRDNSRFAP
jgi:phosphatidylserine/phosphatidylglycerophosphate/cardiolipin synthase-like enzyme